MNPSFWVKKNITDRSLNEFSVQGITVEAILDKVQVFNFINREVVFPSRRQNARNHFSKEETEKERTNKQEQMAIVI